MNETLDWDDLRLFLAVAQAGGLAGATKPTGLSAATLGRRMLALERALGMELFVRHQDGYSLTASGAQLVAKADGLAQGATAIERWRASIDPLPSVRIAAGAWTSSFIARNAPRLVETGEALTVDILTGSKTVDLARREANLGVRNRRPEARGLAGRKLGPVAFAVYGSRAFVDQHPAASREARFDACPWITLSRDGPQVPSAQWLDRRLRRAASLRFSMPQHLLDAALAGAGLCVLPCFIGDAETGLARAGPLIEALGHEQWLVSHDEDRHSRAIRRVSARLAKLFREQRPLFAGQSKKA